MKSLRALVRAVLLEDEDLLAKWAKGAKSTFERELAQKGAVPIYQGSNNHALVGRGASNSAYEVVYKGKRCIARATGYKEEFDAFLNFIRQKDKMNAKYAKHFPELYATFEIKLDSATFYVCIVELLESLPASLKHEIGGTNEFSKPTEKRIRALLDDSTIAVDIARLCAPDDEAYQDELAEFFETKLKPLIQKNKNEILDDIEPLVSVACRQASERSEHGASDSKPYVEFGHSIYGFLRDPLIPREKAYDTNTNRMQVERHPSKTLREFYEFLHTLHASGMSWYDLSDNNYMMRKSTGDLVVVDPGEFAYVNN